jgi:Domain of unknown function (DUF4157)
MGNQRLIQTQTAATDRKQHLDKRTKQPEHPMQEVLGSRAASRHFRAQLQRHQAEGTSSPNPLHSILPSISSVSPRAIQAKPMFRGLSHELTPTTDSDGMVIQAKMTIGAPGDKYEQEADRVAEQVVQKMHAPSAQESMLGEQIQHQKREEDGQALRMKPLAQRPAVGGMAATQDLESSIHRARGGGQPLDSNLQRKLRQAMGADFSGVKVHTDAQSDQLNRSIQAKAFTTGRDVFFRQGAYEPGSRRGQELIAHELTHVQQQSGGAVQRQISRIVTPTVIQRFATTYTSDPDVDYTGGQGITARVGAQNEWPGGQEPTGGIPPIINDLGAIKGRYVAGHLMNEEIAGLADNPNLTVLSIKSNNTHKGYEARLKRLGYWADFIERADVSLSRKYGDKAYEHGADYRVEVVAPSPDGTANFIAEQLLVSGLKLSITPIRRRKGTTGAVEPWPEMQMYKVTDEVVPNVPPYPTAPATTPPTKKKPPKTIARDDDYNWSGYNKVPSSYTTRSGRKSGRYRPY